MKSSWVYLQISYIFNDSQVLTSGDHAINSKKIDVKRARAKPGKIFVGGLSSELSDGAIRDYFSQFGTVTDCELPFDKVKNQRKNGKTLKRGGGNGATKNLISPESQQIWGNQRKSAVG